MCLEQGIHDLILDLALQALFHFALEVGLDFFTHFGNITVTHAQCLGKVSIDFRQNGFIHLLDSDVETDRLPREILGEVISREGHLEGFGLTGLEADHGIFEIGQHRAFTENEGIILGLAALERLTILLAEEIDSHAITLGGGTIDRLITDALLAQHLQRTVHFRRTDLQRDTLDLHGTEVVDGDFGINLEDRREFQMRGAFAGLRLDVRRTGHAQLLIADGLAERLAQRFTQRFVTRLNPILLPHDVGRHLARTEAGHLDVLADFAQLLVDLLVEISDGHRNIQAAFQGARLRSGFCRSIRGVCSVRFH